jgi:hypothetical protein
MSKLTTWIIESFRTELCGQQDRSVHPASATGKTAVPRRHSGEANEEPGSLILSRKRWTSELADGLASSLWSLCSESAVEGWSE